VRAEPAQRPSRRRTLLSVAFGLVVLGVLVAAIARHRDEFATAVGSAPAWVLAAATALQLIAVVSRMEAWHVCIEAAGGCLERRALYHAGGLGNLGSQLNAQVGTATRIATLRKAHPDAAPRVPALIAAEAPIIIVEAAFGALAFFTLVGPLGLPWWAPAAALVGVALVWWQLGKLSRGKTEGWRTGLAALRQARGRNLTIALMSLAIAAQIVRNWLMLHAVGVDASFFDATAVLIAMSVIAQLPVGPSSGAAAAVLILGSGGFAAAAAAGVLLTATGAAGAIIFSVWALSDAAWQRRAGRRAVEGQPVAALRLPPDDAEPVRGRLVDAPVAGASPAPTR
jgi:uncharacterized membrane protein YbhN (UPF0104 family)